jgi:hypothetical protein
MSLALVVIPDPSALSREYRFNAQQVFHLARLEDPALRVDQRDALTAKFEPTREIGGNRGHDHAKQQAGSRDRKPLVGVGRLA